MEPPHSSQQVNQQIPPKLKLPYRISETFVNTHPNYTFVYGNDLYELGVLGLCWVMGGQPKKPNCWPIPVLVKYCPAARKFFDDGNYREFQIYIKDAIDKIPRGNPIIVHPKVGRGCSELHIHAPRLYHFMMQELNKIKYPNVEWDYSQY